MNKEEKENLKEQIDKHWASPRSNLRQMKSKIVTTNSEGISEDGLPTYSQNNELIVNSRVGVTPWFAVSSVKETTPRLLTDEEMNNYHSFEEFKQHKCMLFTYEVYRQVAIKEEKSKESEEKKLYYCLSDNADLSGLYLASMKDVAEHIEAEIGDMHPYDAEFVEYTITPVLMTQSEIDNLPEYEG